MLNKKKSNGYIFFILIPIFMLIASFIYDNAVKVGIEKKYHNDSENIIKEVLTNSYPNKEEIVKNFYEDKNLEIEQLNVTYKNDILYVYNVHAYYAFFGRIFGINKYRTEVNLKGYIKNNEIIIEDVKEG